MKRQDYYLVRLKKDAEVITALKKLAKRKRIKGAFFFGLGVGKDITLGYYALKNKNYIKRKFIGEYEFTSLVGNISLLKKEIIIHCHVTITDNKFNAYGGHLFEGTIHGTCEIIVIPLDRKLKRKRDRVTGLNLLDI